jgi:hypothetical protein
MYIQLYLSDFLALIGVLHAELRVLCGALQQRSHHQRQERLELLPHSLRYARARRDRVVERELVVLIRFLLDISIAFTVSG